MTAYREPTPMDDPFPGASRVLKKELSTTLESFIYDFEHADQNKSAMSKQLNLHEGLMLERSKEIGGRLYLHMQELMQASTDFANGHGKIEMVYECLEMVRDELR
ncbi:MAG: hypothetical protein H7A38_06715 [Chlamydiales bacterium]|nr:hypothetical protein [Chlamydiales bacterium]